MAQAINLPGVEGDLAREIEDRIVEFEQNHEASVLDGGPGWVPRIRPVDYTIAIAVNLVIVVWLVVVLVGG